MNLAASERAIYY